MANVVTENPRIGLCSISEAARFLAVSRGKMYAMLHDGSCPSKRYGKSVRVPWVWLLAQAEVADHSDSEVSK